MSSGGATFILRAVCDFVAERTELRPVKHNAACVAVFYGVSPSPPPPPPFPPPLPHTHDRLRQPIAPARTWGCAYAPTAPFTPL